MGYEILPAENIRLQWEKATVADIDGIDVNMRDDNGWTPLYYAARYNNTLDVTRALLAANANVKARDMYGETPLHHAARCSKNPDIIRILIDANADLEARNEADKTPPDYSPEYIKNIDFVTCVFVDAKNGETPLHHAARYNENPAITRVLIDANANLEARNDADEIPLHHSAGYNNNIDVTRVLVDANSNLEAQNKDKMTPLHFAALNTNLNAILTLLDFGSNPKAKDKNGQTAANLMRDSFFDLNLRAKKERDLTLSLTLSRAQKERAHVFWKLNDLSYD